MNALLPHVVGESTSGGISGLRNMGNMGNMESSAVSSGSFSEHLQDAIAARSEVAPSDRASDSRNQGAVKKDESAGPSTVATVAAGATRATPRESAGEQASDTVRPQASGSGTAVSPERTGAVSDGQSAEAGRMPALPTAQLAGGVAGKISSPQAAPETANEPSQSLVGLSVPTPAPFATPVATSCDFTIAAQPSALAETNSADSDAELANCEVEPGSTGDAVPSQAGSTDGAQSSTSAGKSTSVKDGSGAEDGSGANMEGDSNSPVVEPGNASPDPAVALEGLSGEPALAADAKEASSGPPDPRFQIQDGSKSADADSRGIQSNESIATKGSTSHNTSLVAPPDFRGAYSPAPEGFTGALNGVDAMTAFPGGGNGSAGAASSGQAGAQAGLSLHSDFTSAWNSPAASTESALAGQASTGSTIQSAWDGATSVSFGTPLDAASASTTGGQNAATVSADYPLPGCSTLNLTGFGSSGPTTVVAFQPQSGPGVMSDSSAKGSAQTEGASQTMQEGALEAWQNVAAHLERVNAATLDSLPYGTEMRVQMHTDAFGPLEIRATLEAGKIGAAIGVENPEAHHTLVGQISALQQSLADRHVQLDQVTVVRTSSQNSTDPGWSSNQQRDDSTPFSRLAQQARGHASESEPSLVSETEAGQTENLWGRLSVRA